MTDSDLAKLTTLTELAEVDLAYTKITDRGLERLSPLRSVRVLDLHYAEYVGDVGISHLKQWQNVEFLDLRGTKVTSTKIAPKNATATTRSLTVKEVSSRVKRPYPGAACLPI